MKCIHYVGDERGERTAVVLDLKEHGDLWEDAYGPIRAEQRRGEPREAMEAVKRRLQQQGKLADNA